MHAKTRITRTVHQINLTTEQTAVRNAQRTKIKDKRAEKQAETLPKTGRQFSERKGAGV